MDAVIRGLVVYLFLMLIFRISGKRALAQITSFDFVLLLIIAETTQNAMIDDDASLTNGFLLILTLLGLDIVISLAKQRSHLLGKLTDSVPLVILKDGKPIKDRMDRERVDEADILHSARQLQGLSRLDQIKWAILEQNGGITVVPKEGSQGR